MGHGNSVAYTSSFGATYGSWMSYDDPYNNDTIWLPPSAFVLATIAYSDSISEVWFPAAGFTRGIIQEATAIQYSPTQGERDLMLGPGNSVNPIVDFGNDGLVIWGDKSLVRTDTLRSSFSICRLMASLTRVVELAAKVYVFEPNDDLSRENLVNSLESVLQDVSWRRGIERFEVKDVTTSYHINKKTMRILVFIVPQQAAEKIEIPFVLTSSGQAFADV